MLQEFSRFLDRILQPIGLVFAYLGGASVALMMLLVAVDVVLRYMFSMPLSFSCEFTQILLLIVVFLGIGYCGIRKTHIAIDVVVSRLPKGAQLVLAPVGDFLSLSLLTAITWEAIVQAKIFINFSQTTSGLHVPFSLLLALLSLHLVSFHQH